MQYFYTGKEVKSRAYEYDDRYALGIMAVGMDKSKIECSINKDRLAVSAEPKDEPEGSELYSDFSTSGFTTYYHFPSDADREGVTAEYSDGIIKITIMKMKDRLPTKIKVK